MKIAIASDDQKSLSSHFGETRGFVVYDIVDGQPGRSEYRRAEGHGKGDHHGQTQRALADCQVLICGGMGAGIHQRLKSAGMRIVASNLSGVEESLRAHLAGDLRDVVPHACCHGKASLPAGGSNRVE